MLRVGVGSDIVHHELVTRKPSLPPPLCKGYIETAIVPICSAHPSRTNIPPPMVTVTAVERKKGGGGEALDSLHTTSKLTRLITICPNENPAFGS